MHGLLCTKQIAGLVPPLLKCAATYKEVEVIHLISLQVYLLTNTLITTWASLHCGKTLQSYTLEHVASYIKTTFTVWTSDIPESPHSKFCRRKKHFTVTVPFQQMQDIQLCPKCLITTHATEYLATFNQQLWVGGGH